MTEKNITENNIFLSELPYIDDYTYVSSVFDVKIRKRKIEEDLNDISNNIQTIKTFINILEKNDIYYGNHELQSEVSIYKKLLCKLNNKLDKLKNEKNQLENYNYYLK